MRSPQSTYKLVRLVLGVEGSSRKRYVSWGGTALGRSEMDGNAPVWRVGETDWMSKMHPVPRVGEVAYLNWTVLRCGSVVRTAKVVW